MSGRQPNELKLDVAVDVTGGRLTWNADGFYEGEGRAPTWTDEHSKQWRKFAEDPASEQKLLPDVVATLDEAFGVNSSMSLSSKLASWIDQARRENQRVRVRFRTSSRAPELTELPYGCLTVDVGGERHGLALVPDLSVVRSPIQGQRPRTERFHHSKPHIALVADPAGLTGEWPARLEQLVNRAGQVGSLQGDGLVSLDEVEPKTDIVVIWSHGSIDGLTIRGSNVSPVHLVERLEAVDPLVVVLAVCNSARVANRLAMAGVPIVVANATKTFTLIQQEVLLPLLNLIAGGPEFGLSPHDVARLLADETSRLFTRKDLLPSWGLAGPSVWIPDAGTSYVAAAEPDPVPRGVPYTMSSRADQIEPPEDTTSPDEGAVAGTGGSRLQDPVAPHERGGPHRRSVAVQVDDGSVVWIAVNDRRVESGPDERRRSKPFGGPVDTLCISTSGELVAAQVEDQLSLATIDRSGGLAWSKAVVSIPPGYRIAAMDARGQRAVGMFASATGMASATFYSSGDLSSWEGQSDGHASIAIDGSDTYVVDSAGQLTAPIDAPIDASWIAVDTARSGSSLLVSLLGRWNDGQVVLLQRLQEGRRSVRSLVPDGQLIDLSIVRPAPGSGGPELVAGYSATGEWLVWGWDQAEELS